MSIYELKPDGISPLQPTTFSAVKIKEREDLQRLLRERIEIVAPDTMVIAEEFSDWEDANRRIDLLGVNKQGNLVVIELKRTETGGHMELQALRYAAMVSAMTFERAVDVYRKYLIAIGREEDPDASLREFLDSGDDDESIEERFAQEIQVVLASAEFSKELTTAVIWLNAQGLDIRCVRLRPYADGERILLDVQQVIPLPEAEHYQVKLREKAQKERKVRISERDLSKYDVSINGTVHTGLNKRNAVYVVVRHLCDSGTLPEEIVEAAGRRPGAFRRVEGLIDDENAFIEMAEQAAESDGRVFDARRYFTTPEKLIVSNNCTYALTNQWGGRAIEWVNAVLAKFSDRGVSLKKAASETSEHE